MWKCGCGATASIYLPNSPWFLHSFRGLLLFGFSQEHGAPQAFTKWVSSYNGRPRFGRICQVARSVEFFRKWRVLVGFGQNGGRLFDFKFIAGKWRPSLVGWVSVVRRFLLL